ncbi:MAG TPA: hypothetical protein VGG10_17250 [Rhizomicrobium sp.]|jgi:hypothetical protein
MASDVWLSLNTSERNLLRQALSAFSRAEGADRETINAMTRKIASATPYPDITIGVYGGQVQWTSGNPFPVRIVEYDGDKDDLPNADAEGHPCRIWFEPPDRDRAAA